MGVQSDVSWCDSSVNPTWGCDGCELWTAKTRVCYAGRMTEKSDPGKFDTVVLRPGVMEKAAKWPSLRGGIRPTKPWIPLHYPRIIFISDMSDALSKDVSLEYLEDEIIQPIMSKEGRRHVWMWLTKRPRRMLDFANILGGLWPENLWPGTSITSHASLKRLDALSELPATVHVVSFEPLYESVQFLDAKATWLNNRNKWWFLVGGASGAGARPMNLDWARWLRDEARSVGASYYFKQIGGDPDRQENIEKFPKDLQLREFPETSFTNQE